MVFRISIDVEIIGGAGSEDSVPSGHPNEMNLRPIVRAAIQGNLHPDAWGVVLREGNYRVKLLHCCEPVRLDHASVLPREGAVKVG